MTCAALAKRRKMARHALLHDDRGGGRHESALQIAGNTLPLAHAQLNALLQLCKLLSALTVPDVGQQRGNAGRIPATERWNERSSGTALHSV